MKKEDPQILGVHRIQQVWPNALFRQIKTLALEEETNVTKLTIEAIQALLEDRKNKGDKDKK